MPLTSESLNPHNIAAIVQDNKTLRTFLFALKPQDRQTMYDALVPFLCFKPKPFQLMKWAKNQKPPKHLR